MLGITSMILTRCEDLDYSLFSFYSSSQLSRYLLSQVQFTTLSAPCVIKYKHSWNYCCHTCQRTFSCIRFMFLAFTCPNTLTDAQLLLWSWYYIQPYAPITLAETFNSAAFSAPLDKKSTPVLSLYFPNAVHETHKSPIHIRGSAFKKTPASHSLWNPWAASQMRLWAQILPSSELNGFFAETNGKTCLNLSAAVLTEAGQKKYFLVKFPLLLDQRNPSSSGQL